MGRKAGLSLVDVVDAAQAIADRDRLEAATLTAIAAELGIKTPSLYNHVEGLEGLRKHLAIRGARILESSFRDAVGELTGIDALRAICQADREFAAHHPGLYDSFLPAPSEDEDPELYGELASPIFYIAGFLLDMGIAQEEAIHLIRALRAMLHGFLDLEAKRGFGMPLDIDASFAEAVEMMLAGIETRAAAG